METIQYKGAIYVEAVDSFRTPKMLVEKTQSQIQEHKLSNLIARFNKAISLVKAGLDGPESELRNRKSDRSLDHHFGVSFSGRKFALGNVLLYFNYKIAANHWMLNYYLAKKYKTLSKANKQELAILEDQKNKWEEARAKVVKIVEGIKDQLLQKAEKVGLKNDISHELDRLFNSKPADALK